MERQEGERERQEGEMKRDWRERERETGGRDGERLEGSIYILPLFKKPLLVWKICIAFLFF